ncbi:MAG: HAD family hydrolase [Solirubrobacterales bacterium]
MDCLYVDLDGTLLGPRGSLFSDADGGFTLSAARALQACDRAGAEVVVMTGRREPQAHEAARMFGQRSFIYEAGCGVVLDGERHVLPDGQDTTADGGPHARMLDAGIPQLLLDRYAGRLEHHAPWHTDRVHSHLFRGLIDVQEANELLAAEGHDWVYLLDNGAIGRRMGDLEVTNVYHLMPHGTGKAAAVRFHLQAAGHDRSRCVAVGDSLEDMSVAEVVSRFFVVANGTAKDPGVARAAAATANVRVTEGSMGDGVYQAVVETLARRGA